MSLRSKIVLILVTVVVGYAAIDSTSNRMLFSSSFGRWEKERASESLARVEDRLQREYQDLLGKARVLAGLGDVRRLLDGTEVDLARKDATHRALERAQADLLYVCNADGGVCSGAVLDPDTREPRRLMEFPGEALSLQNPAIAFKPGQEEIAGFLATKDGHHLLIATVPVPDEAGVTFQGLENGIRPRLARGAVVLGRFLGESLQERIVQEELRLAGKVASGFMVQVHETVGPDMPELLTSNPEAGDVTEEGEDGLLHAYRRIESLRTASPMVLHVAMDRDIQAQKRQSVNYTLLSTLIGGLLTLFILLRLLQRIVVKPLSTLTRKAVEIGRNDDTSIRVGMQRDDEIGQLAGEFDRMLDELERSREQVVKTARLAGMSEIATGVLHNVGNVLNSVNVSANLATRKTQDLSVQDLEMLVGVLRRQEDLGKFVTEDPRGQHLVAFLEELSKALSQQREGIRSELGALNQGIEHIAELVRAQQSFAGTRGVFEKASLAAQVDGALAICRQGLATISGLEIVREFDELPSVSVDKHKLMEILVNLIQNAGQAVSERGGGEGRITVRVTRHGEHTARIEVRDTGVGITPENLTRVFNHGFTTKKNGHGFGLHVSANAATEMGAKLHAASDGPGKGAVFFLDIPMQEEPALVAA